MEVENNYSGFFLGVSMNVGVHRPRRKQLIGLDREELKKVLGTQQCQIQSYIFIIQLSESHATVLTLEIRCPTDHMKWPTRSSHFSLNPATTSLRFSPGTCLVVYIQVQDAINRVYSWSKSQPSCHFPLKFATCFCSLCTSPFILCLLI